MDKIGWVMNKQAESRKMIVYGKEGCHLCEEMIASLRVLQKQSRFEMEVINIDRNEYLMQLYSDRVPVLFSVNESKELCHYSLDSDVVDAYFS